MATDHGALLDKIIGAAIRTGDMNSAIAKHGSDLSRAEVAVLTGLSKTELTQLKNLRNKLAPLGRAAADVNGGIF